MVLIHGAFADASSWSSEITQLQHDGYQVIAPAVPLRGLASDAAYVTSVVRNISGPVVLVGHSYGGAVAAEAAATQRPLSQAAASEAAAAGVPAGIPLYEMVATQDKMIPPAAEVFMARRAGATIYTVDSAHDMPVSHPQAVVSVIERAAR